MERWYIGQPIVAIKNSECGKIKKGQDFKILSLRTCPCYCGRHIQMDIGLRVYGEYDGDECVDCGHIDSYTPVFWKNEDLFAPLDQDITELTKLLEAVKS